ncbi:Uncharacterized protein GBIM_16318 [Gryllus bimaculatus]|nr:Uncharacterized protein GBIM_16318 [Gryllus bimaculatus]
MTWSSLRSQLDGVELKKSYVLNPLAPEFIPRQYQLESYIHLPSQFPVDCNTSVVPFAQSPQGEVPLAFQQGSEPPISSCISHPTHIPRPTHIPPPPALHLAPNFPTTNAAPVIFYTGSSVPPVHPPLPMSGPNSNFYPLKTALGTLSIVNSPPILYNSVVPSSLTPLNTWGNHLISPSILRGNPQWGQTMHGDFLKKPGQTAPQIATVFPLPYYEEAQRGGLNSPSRTNGLPNMNGHLGPPQSFLSTSQNSVADCYIPGGVMSPAVLSQCSPSSDTVCTSTNGVADKVEQIQFLHNVHFPEKLVHVKEKRHKEITTVLPPEVSLSQLFNSDAQREWYNHVLETSGLDTANKLMEMVLSDTAETMNPPTPTSPSQECFHPHIVQGLEDLFIDKKMNSSSPVVDHHTETNIQRHHVLSQLNILQHTRQQKIPGDTSNIQAGVILHENELRTYLTAVSRHELVVNDVSIKCSDTATENFHIVQETNPIQVQQETRTDFSSCTSIGDISKQCWPPLPSHNSIAAFSPHSSSRTISSEGGVTSVNDFLDGVVDKTSTAGSGAFAGYARAVSIGFQHYNESTFYSSTHFQPRVGQQLLSNYPQSVVQQDTVSFHSSGECNNEEDNCNCTFPLNHTVRNENTPDVLRTIRTDTNQSNGRKENGGKIEDSYAPVHVSEPKATHQGSRLYQYFS